jgi:ASC-1-like (ASCH) protein
MPTNYLNKYIKYKLKYLKLKEDQTNQLKQQIQFDQNGGLRPKLKKLNNKKSNKTNHLKTNNKYLNQMSESTKSIYKSTTESTESTESKSIVPTFRKHLSEPWFSLISLGIKTVEGRINQKDFAKMKAGDIIEWFNDDFLPRSILTEITETIRYNTFAEYLESEGLSKCLPGMPTLEHGLSVYYKYFSKEDEAEFGINAIKLKVI